MKKLLLFLILNFTILSVHGVEIKLSCDINLKKMYLLPAGTTEEKIDYQEQLTINEFLDQHGKQIVIQSMTDNFFGVTTIKTGDIISRDLSNDNEWNIFNTVEDSNVRQKTTYKIDRHTGRISYFASFDIISQGSKVTIIGNGICKKIDVTKKKF